MSESRYDLAFYERIGGGSRRSALFLCRLLMDLFAPASVLDVGCGDGSWLAAWKEAGAKTLLGLDGDYLDKATLRIAKEDFLSTDLSLPFDLGRRFDLVESLEVAEHLPRSQAEGFVASLARHGDLVLFSAAPPGQFGLHHVNERPYEYWRRLFQRNGFACCDLVRKALADVPTVEPWYRYNTFLYVRSGSPAERLAPVLAHLVPVEVALRDSAPFPWRLRKALFRFMPSPLGTLLAKASARLGKRSAPPRPTR